MIQWNTLNFRRRLLVIMTVSGLFELLVLTAAGFSYIKHTQQNDLAQKAKEVSAFLSRSPEIIQLIQTRQVGEQQQKLRDLTRLIGAAYMWWVIKTVYVLFTHMMIVSVNVWWVAIIKKHFSRG